MEQIIYLEVDDDILTVRDRLRRAQARNVLLVVPSGCKALRRPLDFRLLRRQAAALGLALALVSNNVRVRELALAEELTVFSRLALGRRVARRGARWRTEDLPGVEGLRARLARYKPRWWHWVLGVPVVVLVLITLAWSVFMVWPSATVEVVPAHEPIGVSVWIEASPAIRAVDWERLRMPARVVQIEVVDRAEIETTGITNVAADKAKGTVLFVNPTRRELYIPAGTIVSTSAGTPIRFQTTVAARVGPRGRVRVPVEALEGGPGGNVRANMINRVEGEFEGILKVTNESSTHGGTYSQARRVTHGDKQKLNDLLINKLLHKGHDELAARLEGEFLPMESMWINRYTIRTNYDHHVNDLADTLALEMRAVVGGVAISEETAQELTRRALLRQVRGGFHLLPETVHVSRGNDVQVDQDSGAVRFVMDGVALMEADIDVNLLREAIRGRPVEEAITYLNRTLPVERAPVLRVEPGWMRRVPWMPFRILVVRESDVEEASHALPGS